MKFSTSKQVAAEWQSGYAAACKAVDLGSIPGSASTNTISESANKLGVTTTKARVAKLVDARDLKSLGS